MSRMFARTAAAIALMMTAVACSAGSTGDAATPATDVVTVEPPNEANGTTSPATPADPGVTIDSVVTVDPGAPTDPAPATEATAASVADTVPVVTIEVEGTAVGGNSGGVGREQTQTLSESIRNQDGTCSGWEGPGDGGLWTLGLEVGASVEILDRDSGEQIGEGRITASAWTDVDPSDDEQWDCTFVFKGTVSKAVDAIKIKVADLNPWLALPDPTNAGQYVASVDTKIEISRLDSCTSHEAGQPVFDWGRAVGEFWADGVGALCFNGLIVSEVKRVCRPPDVASEYVVAVRSADDPTVVYEDASGQLLDASTLPADTKVIVDVATGRPC